jgi:hypothetical protein
MLADNMKVLLVPTTEGYGHVSRANAIISGLEKNNIDYHVLTDKKRADFLIANGVEPSKIDDTFYGIRYIYSGKGKSLDVPRTLFNLTIDTPKYFKDYRKVMEKLKGPERFDLVINDVTLPLTKIKGTKVITPCHYNAPKCRKDHKRILRHSISAFSEYLVEPMVNLSTFMADKFNMDFRPHHIDNEKVFPPVVSEIKKTGYEIKRELNIPANGKLIIDGRNDPPIDIYNRFAQMYDDVYFLVRSNSLENGNIRTKPFISGMIDYINASDLFITDTGFTALSEAIITKTPMLLADPGTHIEGFKNYSCAIDEGFGKPIFDLESDLDLWINGKINFNGQNISNGLNAMMKKILSYSR